MSISERLERAFENLRNQNIHPILDLAGATPIQDWDFQYYRQLATLAGREQYVAASTGTTEEGGGYFDEHGRLRYRCDRAPILWLIFHHTGFRAASALETALTSEGFIVCWSGRDTDPVKVDPSAAFEDVVPA